VDRATGAARGNVRTLLHRDARSRSKKAGARSSGAPARAVHVIGSLCSQASRVFLYAFDLIELNGDDLRRDPLEVRKAALRGMLAKAGLGLRFNEHIEGDGPTVFAHACKMGLEGIVSKRKDSAYRSGRSPDWLKMKNANAPAVRREAEED